MADRRLPAGWTLEEIRKVSGDQEARPLDPDRVVTGWPARSEQIRPEIVLGFHGLCPVKAANDDDWYMGSLNDDGSVICWSIYGNLYEALRGL
ncbi:hypothetical protein ACFXDH_30340 [Streptomyces sp. NPDC059467]|uniref:hypothetical protein n=1 Tax=Streptomyces sp. NPDC059467 TaxID=3346844 RepID=UPI0036809205